MAGQIANHKNQLFTRMLKNLKFQLTEHAECVIKRRSILVEWIDRVISQPQIVEPDDDEPELEHRFGRVPEYGNRVLRVVVNPSVEPLKIVTAFFDRKMRDKL